MHRSISIVEYKTHQAAFFVRQLENSGYDIFAAQCYTDAFAASARSVTLALQAVVGKVEGFSDWYANRQDALRQDRLARFFVDYRNVSSKIGDTVVRAGQSCRGPNGKPVIRHYFLPIQDLPEVPQEDVVTICRRHMSTLLSLVFDAMAKFKYALDDRWYFTEENFSKMGKTFRDAVTELGFPAEWADAARVLDEPDRWRVLRKTETIGCQLNDLFVEYLGTSLPGPDEETEQTSGADPRTSGGTP